MNFGFLKIAYSSFKHTLNYPFHKAVEVKQRKTHPPTHHRALRISTDAKTKHGLLNLTTSQLVNVISLSWLSSYQYNCNNQGLCI